MKDVEHSSFSRKHLARTIYGIILALILLSANSVAVSLLTEKVFSSIGWTPSRFLNFPLQFFLTIIFLVLESRIFILFRPRRTDAFSQFIDAFRKISRGDYNVHIENEDEHGHFSRLTGGLNEMAESLRRMEEMRQQFISDMSHEIQSPLTSIRGFARILREENLDEMKKISYLEIIEEESRRLSRLSEELLEMTRFESPDLKLHPVSYSLDRQIREIVLNYEPQWREKKIAISIDLEEATVRADRDLMARLWSNLLHNAIKFTPEGKGISLSLHSDSDDVQFFSVAISDEGIGISSEELSLIFDRFHKADKSRNRENGKSGSGLGLSIVRKIVELHGGEVTAVSPGLNRGTKITVKIPVM